MLQDWQDSNPVLTLDGEQIEVVEKFVYLGSCISAGGGVSDETNARIVKARAAYANLGHLWRLRDVSLAVRDRIYNASNEMVNLETVTNKWKKAAWKALQELISFSGEKTTEQEILSKVGIDPATITLKSEEL
ncbi:unnamed protein product [Schistosoma margrebowiei]|uniref:Uncharacterized protein n=1 Tax=Schistosoma margrebowiei TaxID=48269 RepID=A0A3P8CKK4_9TREM|nr:unnamed protein product [Schistosoma margrebowiei]